MKIQNMLCWFYQNSQTADTISNRFSVNNQKKMYLIAYKNIVHIASNDNNFFFLTNLPNWKLALKQIDENL